mmetsp:Transcript_54665/g.119252  ORF Transcript_54665/g.119252 Transcript_54665/m.119252 type:complete len:209 (+) Transcript_54665:347-973(+)
MPSKMQSSDRPHPALLSLGTVSPRATRPATTPVTMVEMAAKVHTTTARPSFIPRFWQKMPVDEKSTLAPTPSALSAGTPSSCAKRSPVLADAADKPNRSPACMPAMTSTRMLNDPCFLAVFIASPMPVASASACNLGKLDRLAIDAVAARRETSRKPKIALKMKSSSVAAGTCGMASSLGVAVAPTPTVPIIATATPARSTACSSSWR